MQSSRLAGYLSVLESDESYGAIYLRTRTMELLTALGSFYRTPLMELCLDDCLEWEDLICDQLETEHLSPALLGELVSQGEFLPIDMPFDKPIDGYDLLLFLAQQIVCACIEKLLDEMQSVTVSTDELVPAAV